MILMNDDEMYALSQNSYLIICLYCCVFLDTLLVYRVFQKNGKKVCGTIILQIHVTESWFTEHCFFYQSEKWVRHRHSCHRVMIHWALFFLSIWKMGSAQTFLSQTCLKEWRCRG